MTQRYFMWEPIITIHFGDRRLDATVWQCQDRATFGFHVKTGTGDDYMVMGFDSQEEAYCAGQLSAFEWVRDFYPNTKVDTECTNAQHNVWKVISEETS